MAQQAAIAHIGQVALGHLSVEELFAEAAGLVSRVLESEPVSLLELAPDRESLRVVAGVGWRPGIVGELVLGTSTESQGGFTLQAGTPVIVGDYEAETRFKVHPVIMEHGALSGMSVRIGDAQKPFGALAAFSSRRDRFTRDDANFLQAVANVLAAAVERLSTEAQLRSSRDQLAAIVSTIDEGITVRDRERLIFANDAAARLSGFQTAQEMLDASGSVVDRFDLFDAAGQPLPVDQLPGRRAMAEGRSAEGIVGFRTRGSGEVRWSIVRANALRDESGQVTHVINTFHDITDERWAEHSQSLMADAVAVLSSTLDAREAARRLAELAVPRLADYCTVHLRNPDGTIENVALAHIDPARVEIAVQLRDLRPTDPDAPTGIARVIREGVHEIGDITPGLVQRVASMFTPDEFSLFEQLEMRSYLVVPLTGRSGPIGALSLVMAESGRRLGERDLALAQELGERAGIALENAQLYETSDDRRAQLDAVLAALAEGVIVFAPDGTRQLANSAAERMFRGRLPADIDELHRRIGLDSERHRHDEAEAQDQLEVQIDAGPRWIDIRRYRTTGNYGGNLGVRAPTVMVLRDVTDARAAAAARDAFLGVLSHELRTPITTIYGGSELLQRGMDAERGAEVINDIRDESERLARLVEDLLVMTRIEGGTVEISDEPILIQRLLPIVVQSFHAQRPDVKVSLTVDPRLSAVRGDPTYVEQVVRNLLTNAARYGRGAESGVELTAVEQEGVEVCVRVLDRGPGLGESDPERLFELFYRTEAARSVPGGAGIGLFVCRHLIEAMGGRIWASNREGGGAEFGFTLPVVESDLAI